MIGILSCVKITSTNQDATSATVVCSDTEADGKSSEKSKKLWKRIGCFSEGG